MNILSQQNPLWKNLPIGLSKLTIGADGCLLTSCAMVNNLFGANCTPAEVAAHTNWFSDQGDMIWSALELKNAIFINREFYNNSEIDLTKIKAFLSDPTKAVILEVQLPHNGTHWMLADYENNINADLFYCCDPWSGLVKLSDYYGPIIGAAFFEKRSPALI